MAEKKFKEGDKVILTAELASLLNEALTEEYPVVRDGYFGDIPIVEGKLTLAQKLLLARRPVFASKAELIIGIAQSSDRGLSDAKTLIEETFEGFNEYGTPVFGGERAEEARSSYEHALVYKTGR